MSRAGRDGDLNIRGLEQNNYPQGRTGSGTPCNPGPARGKGDLGRNTTMGGGINRSTKGVGTGMSGSKTGGMNAGRP